LLFSCDRLRLLQSHHRPYHLCHILDDQSPASNYSGLGSIPYHVRWNLWCTKWQWGRFSTGTCFPYQFSIPPTAWHSLMIPSSDTIWPQY
jgi:hypothetical protein